jgi:hypothetical protein
MRDGMPLSGPRKPVDSLARAREHQNVPVDSPESYGVKFCQT